MVDAHFLGNIDEAPSRVHNALRNVGKFPLIITTNMDDLLERFIWMSGNGGETLQLDQVGVEVELLSISEPWFILRSPKPIEERYSLEWFCWVNGSWTSPPKKEWSRTYRFLS